MANRKEWRAHLEQAYKFQEVFSPKLWDHSHDEESNNEITI